MRKKKVRKVHLKEEQWTEEKKKRKKVWMFKVKAASKYAFKVKRQLDTLLSRVYKVAEQIQYMEARELIFDEWARENIQGYKYREKEFQRIVYNYTTQIAKLKVLYDIKGIKPKDLEKQIDLIKQDLLSVRKAKAETFNWNGKGMNGYDKGLYNYIKWMYVEKLQYGISPEDDKHKDYDIKPKDMNDYDFDKWANWVADWMPPLMDKDLIVKALKEANKENSE